MRTQLQDRSEWHTIFAWFPHTTKDGVSVWLEPVERRLKFVTWFDDYYEYRLPAIAAATGTAKTAKLAECEASQSVIAQPSAPSEHERRGS